MRQRILFLSLACVQFLGCAAQDTARLMQATSPPATPSAQQAASSQGSAGTAASGLDVRLPLESKSIRFAVVGDTGTGEREEYQVAQELETYRQKVGFDFVIMMGDNIYGSHTAKDFTEKFELPFKPMLDAGVKFYAVLGNHDEANERFYKPFHMDGRRYYTFRVGNVRFFALHSDYMDPDQVAWLTE